MNKTIVRVAALAAAAFVLAGPTAFANSQEPPLTGATFKQGDGKTTKRETTNPDRSKTTTETTMDKDGRVAKETKSTVDKDGKKTSESSLERDKTGKTTEKDTKFNDDGSTTGKTTETTTDKNGTKKVEQTDSKNGKPVRKSTETTDKNGGYREDVVDDDLKTKSTATGKKSGGVKTTEDKTEVNGKGETKRTKSEFNPDGSPKKVDEVTPDGKKVKSSTDYKDGKPVKKTEYDKSGRKTSETEFYDDGKPKKKTEYDKSGKVKSTEETDKDGTRTRTDWKNGNKDVEVVEHPDGTRTVTEFKNGKPVKTTEYDKKGKPVTKDPQIPGPEGSLLQGMVVAAPDAFVPGQSLTFSTSADAGNVVVTTGDGTVVQARHIEGELWGIVVPAEAKTLHIRAGDVVVGALAVAALASHGGSGKPQVNSASPFAAPGDVITLNGQQFDPLAGGNLVTIGGRPATVLASSPVSLTVVMPGGVSTGDTEVRVRANGQESDPVTMTSVNLQWDPAPSTMTIGQKARRNLRIVGTDQPVRVMIQDPMGDSAEVPGKGLRQSAGGANNVVSIEIVPLRLGSYSVMATVAAASQKAEQDRKNAGASARDRDDWNRSAKDDTNAERAQQKRNAAANAHKASQDWEAAAKARENGQDDLAKKLEDAAKLRDKAANEWGANGDKAAAEKAEKDAAAKDGK